MLRALTFKARVGDWVRALRALMLGIVGACLTQAPRWALITGGVAAAVAAFAPSLISEWADRAMVRRLESIRRGRQERR